MKKSILIVCALSLFIGLGVSSALAAPENTASTCSDKRDNDKDKLVDCADPDCAAFCAPTCVDTDSDGYGNPGLSSCPNGSATDCNNNNASIYPGATELCTGGVDEDCDGLVDCADPGCSTNPACQASSCTPTVPQHAGLTYAGYPSNCLGCHDAKATEVLGSVHYKWAGPTPDMLNQPGTTQGKISNAVNSYCINILGDWPACGACHAGRGKNPASFPSDKANVDCLMCHNAAYAMARIRLADGSMGVSTPNDCYVQEVTKPTRTNCLKCHANAGGGDAVKRGDLSMATITNTDANFDVHMDADNAATNLSCQSCHTFVGHKVTGKGSDLRPTDYASEVACTTCHTTKGNSNGHATAAVNRHQQRVACQSCHVPTYAKVATETHRDWRYKHDGRDATTCTSTDPCPGHPHADKAANLTPELRFWNRKSDNALLGEIAQIASDTGLFQTSRPDGDINGPLGNKLYPFKYKTAAQPLVHGGNCDGKLLALDTFVYLKGTGNVNDAVNSGLANQGCTNVGSIEWVTTDTFGLLNHGVPTSATITCTQCHPSGNLDPTTDSKLDKVGYKLKGPASQICSQCHREKSPRGQDSMHGHLNKGSGIDCYFCHTFTRAAERGLCSPCDPACVAEFVDTNPFAHTCN